MPAYLKIIYIISFVIILLLYYESHTIPINFIRETFKLSTSLSIQK